MISSLSTQGGRRYKQIRSTCSGIVSKLFSGLPAAGVVVVARGIARSTVTAEKISVSGVAARLKACGVEVSSKTSTSDVQALLRTISASITEQILAGVVTTTVAARIGARGHVSAGKISDSSVAARIAAKYSVSVSKTTASGLSARIRVRVTVGAGTAEPPGEPVATIYTDQVFVLTRTRQVFVKTATQQIFVGKNRRVRG